MKIEADGREGCNAVASTTFKRRKGVEGLTWAELFAKWTSVVETLKAEGVEVVNPGHALEGALSIRYGYGLSTCRLCMVLVQMGCPSVR